VILHSRFEGADVAADIISAGPEPLTSQFAAGYGMVLNLLHTRSLDEARAFLERSFGNYMGERAPTHAIMSLPVAQRVGFRCKMHAQQVSSQQVAGGPSVVVWPSMMWHLAGGDGHARRLREIQQVEAQIAAVSSERAALSDATQVRSASVLQALYSLVCLRPS
jgi:superfamily II RNA helicase